MSEMYWITRLDGLCFAIHLLMTMAMILAVVDIATWLVCWEDEEKRSNLGRKIFFRLLTALLILGILAIFIPSEKQMYKIYGLGGMIELVRNNDEVKDLPDKTIKALDLFLDEYLEKEQN